MSGGLGGWSIPGTGAGFETFESEILWGADQARSSVIWQGARISGASRDAGSSPTTLLRPGLLMGKLDASGKFEEWDADASDGTQNVAGILDIEMKATDYGGVDTDRVFRMMVARGEVKARKLFIQGLAFIGHADEMLARQQLAGGGFVFDDDPMGYLIGGSLAGASRSATVTGTTDALTAAESGTTLFYNNAASVTVTLPTLKPGLSFKLIRTADEEFIVASAEGDNIIAGNDLSADSVTFTTAGEHIGATINVQAIYMGTTLKWRIWLDAVPLGVGLDAWTYSIAS